MEPLIYRKVRYFVNRLTDLILRRCWWQSWRELWQNRLNSIKDF